MWCILRFGEVFNKCARYVLEDNINVGCDHHYGNLITERSSTFTTQLVSLNNSFQQIHQLKNKGMNSKTNGLRFPGPS